MHGRELAHFANKKRTCPPLPLCAEISVDRDKVSFKTRHAFLVSVVFMLWEDEDHVDAFPHLTQKGRNHVPVCVDDVLQIELLSIPTWNFYFSGELSRGYKTLRAEDNNEQRDAKFDVLLSTTEQILMQI